MHKRRIDVEVQKALDTMSTPSTLRRNVKRSVDLDSIPPLAPPPPPLPGSAQGELQFISSQH